MLLCPTAHIVCGLEGFQRCGRQGPSIQKLCTSWSGKVDSGSEMRSRGEAPYISTFWDVHLLLVPHAIWR